MGTPLKSNIDTQNDAMFVRRSRDTSKKPMILGIYVRFRGVISRNASRCFSSTPNFDIFGEQFVHSLLVLCLKRKHSCTSE